MEIKIQIRKRIFSISFGYTTSWYSQIHFITIIEEFYDETELTYTKMIWKS